MRIDHRAIETEQNVEGFFIVVEIVLISSRIGKLSEGQI